MFSPLVVRYVAKVRVYSTSRCKSGGNGATPGEGDGNSMTCRHLEALTCPRPSLVQWQLPANLRSVDLCTRANVFRLMLILSGPSLANVSTNKKMLKWF